MSDESLSPDEQITLPAPILPADPGSPALATDLEDSFFETRRLRHDGWDGPAMATFCRALAETGIVTEACRACGKSAQSAYARRQREPLFARAWESALSLARERLADDLLARSLKGSAEQIIRDGCIWGERHVYDNKLAFAILRRLDRRAELGATFRTPPADRIPDPVPAVSGDWQLLLNALSEDRNEDAALLLTPIPPVPSASNGSEVDEVDNPPVEGEEGHELDEPYVPKRVWQEYRTDAWRTDFPPPPGFEGEQKGKWEEPGYSRALTPAELAAVTGGQPGEGGVTIEDDEADRVAFFAALGIPPPSLRATCEGEELDAPADGGGSKARRVTKDCPPPKPSAKGKG